MSDSGTLRSIAWRDLFPWLIIFRSFGISLGLTAMLAAMLGALLMPLGWKASAAMFLDRDEVAKDADLQGFVTSYSRINLCAPSAPIRLPEALALPEAAGVPARLGIPRGGMLHGPVGDWSKTLQRLALPMRRWFEGDMPIPEFAFYLFGGLWSLAVWAFCGGIIVRQAIVKFSVGERISLRSTVTHTCSKYLAYFSAPLFPLILVALITLPIALVGLLIRLGSGGAFVVALIWILVLIGGVIMAVVLLGLLFGWPLLWGAIASEKHSDSFDAVSRAYSYVFQRPLHYLFYALLASLFGALCWILVGFFVEAVIHLSWWSASFGSGAARAQELQAAIPNHAVYEGFDRVVVSLFAFWEGLIRLLGTGFRYSFFWTATAAIYLLLRYDADHTEMDEVFLEDEENLRSLPTLETDEQGVPVAPAETETEADPPPGDSPAEPESEEED